MRGKAISIQKILKGTDTDINSGKAVEFDDGLAEGDGECCHGISPLISGAALLPHAALIKLVDLLLFTNTRLRLIVGLSALLLRRFTQHHGTELYPHWPYLSIPLSPNLMRSSSHADSGISLW